MLVLIALVSPHLYQIPIDMRKSKMYLFLFFPYSPMIIPCLIRKQRALEHLVDLLASYLVCLLPLQSSVWNHCLHSWFLVDEFQFHITPVLPTSTQQCLPCLLWATTFEPLFNWQGKPFSEDIVNIQHTAGNNHPHCRESEAFKIQNGGAGPPFPPFRLLDCKSHVIIFVGDQVKNWNWNIAFVFLEETQLASNSLNFLKKTFQQNSRQKIFQVERYIRWKIFQMTNISGEKQLASDPRSHLSSLLWLCTFHAPQSLFQATWHQIACSIDLHPIYLFTLRFEDVIE